ncbi:MAG TPA: DUF371 domain-containing protein, partial [Candidatus Nanoarchaeia archaeon]|nr:DUF371 domain-containing protein [Candidatus Nanoarchaeia archaeon]
MNSYTFQAFGHKNIRAAHRTTLELTREGNVTPAGDCIVGVRATFELQRLKPFLLKEKIKITLRADGMEEEIIAVPNPRFTSGKEIVIRTTGFVSERTFAIHATKSAAGLRKDFKSLLCRPETVVTVTIT